MQYGLPGFETVSDQVFHTALQEYQARCLDEILANLDDQESVPLMTHKMWSDTEKTLEILRSTINVNDPFERVLNEIRDLHNKKGADYGTTEDQFANVRASTHFGMPAWVGCAMRGNDKMVRIQSFCTKGKLENESLRDALIDWAVYGILAVMLYDEETTK